jgi:Zn-dependent protease
MGSDPLQSAALIIGLFELVLLIFSLSVHECSHALTASWLGDQTARLEGRVTLNPMYHIDPVGTLLFPAIAIFGPFIGLSIFSGMLIGWAKPTPIISRNFHKIRRDENLVTLAGPASNLLLVFIALLVLIVISVFVPGGHDVVIATFSGGLMQDVNSGLQAAVLLSVLAIEINFSLLFFNLLPVPPLDGSRLLRNILPYNAVQAYDRIPFWVSWLLMIFVGGTVLRILLRPAMTIVFNILARV